MTDHAPMIGRTLSHYRIERQLGAGGMGSVYRARDLALGRDVAIKVVTDALDSLMRERLLREAETGARLQHPAIATFFEAGHAGGVAFIAMEYVRGSTLRDRLARGPLPADEAVATACALLEGRASSAPGATPVSSSRHSACSASAIASASPFSGRAATKRRSSSSGARRPRLDVRTPGDYLEQARNAASHDARMLLQKETLT